MKHEIQRIEPFSAVRIGFFIGLLAGFIFGLVEAILFKTLSATSGASLLPPEAQQMVTMSGVSIILLAILVLLFFSLIFALCGGLTAYFYNLVARNFGGLELYLSDEPAAQRDADAEDASVEDEENV